MTNVSSNPEKNKITVHTTVPHGKAPMSCTWDPKTATLTIKTHPKLCALVRYRMTNNTEDLDDLKKLFSDKNVVINHKHIVVKGNLRRKKNIAKTLLKPVNFMISLFLV